MLVLRNATVFSSPEIPPAQGATVIVSGNRIKHAGTDKGVAYGADIVIDLKGRFVLPGFIDAHVHFGGADNFDYPGISNRHESYDFLKARYDALGWGVTTIRSAGDYTPEIFGFRDEVELGKVVSPRIVSAGRMFQAWGGHPMYTVFGSNENMIKGCAVIVDDETDVEIEVKKLVGEGADWIKAFMAVVNKVSYNTPIPRISPEKIKRIIDAAHKHGKPCMIHVDNSLLMREAAEAGADSIEHVFSVGATETEIEDDLIELLIKKQIFVVPTVQSIKAHENPDGEMPLVYDKLISQVNKMIKAGVNIGVGTDAAIPFVPLGESLHGELEQLVKCGMSPAQAIVAATSGNARLLRKENELGSVLPGFLADLVVIDGDPLKDITMTRNIYLVIMNGKIVVDNSPDCDTK